MVSPYRCDTNKYLESPCWLFVVGISVLQTSISSLFHREIIKYLGLATNPGVHVYQVVNGKQSIKAHNWVDFLGKYLEKKERLRFILKTIYVQWEISGSRGGQIQLPDLQEVGLFS